MAKPRAKRLTDQQVQSIAQALADPRRFAILQQVAAEPTLPCSAVRECQEISPATVSHHIKELSDAGLIDVVREGRNATLSLRRDVWSAYLDRLAKL
jgi:ArsR family transcriptional regulator